MKCMYYFNIAIFISLLALFLWQSSISLIKLTSLKTNFYNTIMEEDTVLYPSVTVCKKYTFDTYLDHMFENKDINLTEVKELVIANSWDIEEVFYFFTHPNMLGLTFPCTTDGGTDPGKPCMFPYKDYHYYDDYDYAEFFQHACVKMQTTSPACYTRLTENQTTYTENDVQEFWGYCPENDNGEKANPDTEYNLAKNEFAQLW